MNWSRIFQFENEGTDPWRNLAVEEYLLREYSSTDPLFLIWRNEPVVVVGKNQNPYEEINLPFLNEHKIKIVRRLSGGGAVYHDPGNLNYTFIHSLERPGFDFTAFTAPILKALKNMGISASLSGRNDLMIDGRKISGSAQVRDHQRILHHGTLLFQTDLDIMDQVLHVSADKFQSKGISSVRSRVANIIDYLPEMSPISDIFAFQNRLIQEIGDQIPGPWIRKRFSDDQEKRIRELRDQKYSSWEWNFGKSPTFNLKVSRRFPWGKLTIGLNIHHGRIREGAFFGDFFALNDPNDLISRILDLPLDRKALENALTEEDVQNVFPELKIGDLIDLIFA
ncbi:MAG: lipoate--protein ligase [Planctomycetia bacterium]|nr:lipoate--protein ligase [Planctomycetia bacterium]